MMKKELQSLLNQEIPLSKALGVTVLEAGSNIVLSAPLAPNINHKQTAFGGSLYSVAVLAGWSSIWARMQEDGIKGHIVIAGSEMEYKESVDGDFVARCGGPDPDEWERTLEIYERWGKARVSLEVSVETQGKQKVIFRGDYAIVN
jgi:thioesterase domain-containing protein